MTYINRQALSDIRTRLADYEMKILHADGVYRRMLFYSTTDPFPGNCAFDVVTWPGHAWIGGDWCKGHAIAREHDMLTEFLNVNIISYGYWAEKMRLTRDTPVTQRSERAYEEWARETAWELAADYSLTESDTQDITDAYMDLVNPDHPNVVDWRDLENLDPLEFDAGRNFRDVVEVQLAISDAWELTFTEYTHDFLVACEGLRFAAEKWEERTQA